MKEKELSELGFKPKDINFDGSPVSYHPEGVTYCLQNGDFTLFAYQFCEHLSVKYKNEDCIIVTIKITPEKIKKVLQWKNKSDIVTVNL